MTARGGQRPLVVRCVTCPARAQYPAYRCAQCASPLITDPPRLSPGDDVADPDVSGVWRHRPLLPESQHAVTLGEGATPTIDLPVQALGVELDGPMRLVAKLESLNPTLSFKDRAMALGASVALDLGLEGLVLASTGNAAVSAAAYAAAAGLRCRVVCGTGSGAGQKLGLASTHGAEVEVVDGDYSDAYRIATGLEGRGWLNVTTTYRNPLLAEAYRGLAVEVVDDIGEVPDVVIVPVGAGPLLAGLASGFQDLVDVGRADRRPRMVGVQASACAPLARAWHDGDWLRSLHEPMAVGTTRAGAIADALRGYEDEGLITLNAVAASEGTVVAVDELEITAALTSLAHVGVHVEAAAATAVAAVTGAASGEVLGTSNAATVVCVLTGHGAKEPVVA